MSYFIWIGAGAILLSLIGGLLHLAQANAKLRRDVDVLSNLVQDQRTDMQGICMAGVNLDRLLLEQDRRLRECLEQMDSFRQGPVPGQPYHAAIERIRQGATAEQLVSELGLSLSEATLLVRLYAAVQLTDR